MACDYNTIVKERQNSLNVLSQIKIRTNLSSNSADNNSDRCLRKQLFQQIQQLIHHEALVIQSRISMLNISIQQAEVMKLSVIERDLKMISSTIYHLCRNLRFLSLNIVGI